jgi:hypothetical protein
MLTIVWLAESVELTVLTYDLTWGFLLYEFCHGLQ